MTQYMQTFLQIIHMFPFVRFLHIAEEADQTFSSSYIKQNESVTELVFVCVVSILVSQLNILQEELSILGSNCGTSNLSWRVAMTWSKLDPRIDSPPPPPHPPSPAPAPPLSFWEDSKPWSLSLTLCLWLSEKVVQMVVTQVFVVVFVWHFWSPNWWWWWWWWWWCPLLQHMIPLTWTLSAHN